jgi:tetratricopeptide (TPR) repeat protein
MRTAVLAALVSLVCVTTPSAHRTGSGAGVRAPRSDRASWGAGVPNDQKQMMGDELYAAYLRQGPSILIPAFAGPIRWGEFRKDFFEKVFPRWERQERLPSKAMFLFDVALTIRPRLNLIEPLHVAQTYLRQRPDPPGVNPHFDAFEIQWNKTAIAFLSGLRQPASVETFAAPLAARIVPARNGDVKVLVDPWIALAQGFVHEGYIQVSHQTCSGAGCVVEARGQAALDAYAVASQHDATRAEAVVRSARVLLIWKRPADALAMLETFDERGAADRAVVYWARLLRAKALDDLDRQDEAIAAYGTALELSPAAQSPRMGLLLIQAKRGHRDGVAEIADAVRRAPDPVVDPWWLYPHFDQRFYEERLKALRRMVTK